MVNLLFCLLLYGVNRNAILMKHFKVFNLNQLFIKHEFLYINVHSDLYKYRILL